MMYVWLVRLLVLWACLASHWCLVREEPFERHIKKRRRLDLDSLLSAMRNNPDQNHFPDYVQLINAIEQGDFFGS
jgi:hypothetical protein